MNSSVQSNAEVQYFCLEVLSPIHIGSGTTLSPLDCQVVQEADGTHSIYTIDFDAWLNSLSSAEAQSFSQIFAQSDLLKVWERVHASVDKEAFCLAKSATNKFIYEAFRKRLRSERSANELVPATRNALYANMIIPGSSLKGAIRTAIIDELDVNGTLRREGDSKLIDWFGKIGENAFQALKVSDLEVLPMRSQFVEGIERKLKDNSKGAPKLSCEVAPQGERLYGRLLLGRNLDSKNTAKTPLADWNINTLRDVCNRYYQPRFLDEQEKFYTKPQFADVLPRSKKIWQKITQNPQAILLRVGHYSHVECITVKDNAPQVPPAQKGAYGKTRTHAYTPSGEYWPFGWALLHPCSAEEYAKGMMQYSEEKSSILNTLAEKRKHYIAKAEALQRHQAEEAAENAKRVAEAQKAYEAKRIAEAEQEALRIAQKREKEARVQEELAQKEAEAAHLASLSPQEQAIARTLQGSASAEDVAKAFEALDTSSDAVLLAEAIKKIWTKEKNKWSGKGMKKAQEDRVKKIKEILAKAKNA